MEKCFDLTASLVSKQMTTERMEGVGTRWKKRERHPGRNRLIIFPVSERQFKVPQSDNEKKGLEGPVMVHTLLPKQAENNWSIFWAYFLYIQPTK